MFLIKNITTHNFQNRNATLDGAERTVCEFKHLYEIYLQSFMFQIKRDKNIASHNFQNGNTWIVRRQVNYARYVCESTNICKFVTKSV